MVLPEPLPAYGKGDWTGDAVSAAKGKPAGRSPWAGGEPQSWRGLPGSVDHDDPSTATRNARRTQAGSNDMETASQFSHLEFDSVVAGAPGRVAGQTNYSLGHRLGLVDLLVVGLIFYCTWLGVSTSFTCSDRSRSPFWWYTIFHGGVWFWASLVGMVALFDISLARPPQAVGREYMLCVAVVGKASLCTAFGMILGSTGLYLWHVLGERLDAGLSVVIVSKAIIMASVGLSGVCFTFMLSFSASYAASGRSSVWSYLIHEGLCPVAICCSWCAVWLITEIASQCFPPFTQKLHELLPHAVVPVLEAAYVESFSVLVLPILRLLMGPLERHFLPPGNRGDRVQEFTFSMRVINWIDLLFEGFRWQYIRIIFDKASPVTIVAVTVYHMVVSIYTYYWKYCPHKMAARITYFHSDCKQPPAWSALLESRPILQKALLGLTQVGMTADLLSASIFSSTYFVLNLAPTAVPISFTGHKRVETPGTRRIGTLTVLNHRFDIVQGEQEGRSTEDKVWPLELTEFAAAGRLSTLKLEVPARDEGPAEGSRWLGREEAKRAIATSRHLGHAHMCVLSMQQHVEVRLRGRQCMRLFASLVLLGTNLTLAAFDSRLVRDPVGPLSASATHLWVCPLLMLFSDLFEAFCLWHTYQGWLFSYKAVRKWGQETFGDPVFLVAQLGVMLHVSMSPMFGRHTLRFCID